MIEEIDRPEDTGMVQELSRELGKCAMRRSLYLWCDGSEALSNLIR